MATEALIFKGMGRGLRRGLSIWIPRNMTLNELVRDLRERLRDSQGFFQGTHVALEGRPLSEEERQVLKELVAEFGLILQDQPDPALQVEPRASEPGAAGQPAVQSAVPYRNLAVGGDGHSGAGGAAVAAGGAEPAGAPGSAEEEAAVDWASLVPADDQTLLVRRTLRSGQRIHYDGNVVIMGDVNPGAVVICTGDIVVFGRLRGVAHAGAQGNVQARVVAFRLEPTQLRIAHFISRAPDEGPGGPDLPEVALVNDGVIEIQAFLP